DDEFLRVPAELLAMSGRKAIEKLLYAYLTYREADNGVAWPHQRTIAADLGCSLPTIQAALQRFEAEHVIQVRHAHGGLKQGNRYRTTNKLSIGAILSPRAESGTKKRDTKHNTSEELKGTNSKQKDILPGLLSWAAAKDGAVQALVCSGVSRKVASALVYNDLHSLENVRNAIANAHSLRWWLTKTDRFRAERFKIPGYIVRTLNRARSEAHEVRQSKWTRLALATKRDRGRALMSTAEFGQRRALLLAQIREMAS
ncbi:MAG: helix-turn-helix domain-containing protein, partial [Planctomycetota bacterium]